LLFTEDWFENIISEDMNNGEMVVFFKVTVFNGLSEERDF
jgi:hypothetical protein